MVWNEDQGFCGCVQKWGNELGSKVPLEKGLNPWDCCIEAIEAHRPADPRAPGQGL